MGMMGDFSATVPSMKALMSDRERERKRARESARARARERESERDSAFNESFDVIKLLQRRLLLDQVNLILEDDDVLELHDLNSSQVPAAAAKCAMSVPISSNI